MSERVNVGRRRALITGRSAGHRSSARVGHSDRCHSRRTHGRRVDHPTLRRAEKHRLRKPSDHPQRSARRRSSGRDCRSGSPCRSGVPARGADQSAGSDPERAALQRHGAVGRAGARHVPARRALGHALRRAVDLSEGARPAQGLGCEPRLAAVRVAVIDSGVTATHPDLSGKVVAHYNAVTGTSSVTDAVGHGTMVASMIAAKTDNAAGIAGVGWNTDLLVIKVADSHNKINDADVAEGVDWAVRPRCRCHQPQPRRGRRRHRAQDRDRSRCEVGRRRDGAAGNDGTSAKFYPAALPGVVAVGATSPGGTARASFSQHGSWVDVAAPGVGIVGANRTGSGYLVGRRHVVRSAPGLRYRRTHQRPAPRCRLRESSPR